MAVQMARPESLNVALAHFMTEAEALPLDVERFAFAARIVVAKSFGAS